MILGLKGANTDQKGPKWAGIDFSRTVNTNFLKEDNKISFYTKNQQNSTNCLEDIRHVSSYQVYKEDICSEKNIVINAFDLEEYN